LFKAFFDIFSDIFYHFVYVSVYINNNNSYISETTVQKKAHGHKKYY